MKKNIANIAQTTAIIAIISVMALAPSVQAAQATQSEMEQQAFDTINQKRAARGLSPLVFRADILPVARAHSQDQARRNCLSHTDTYGRSAGDRLDAVSIPWMRFGENVGLCKGYSNLCQMVCDAWVASPGHAANIFDPNLVESAVGVAHASDGTVYLTQVFVTR